MAVRTIKKSWWVDLTFNHIRIRKRSPQNSKSGAQAYEALLRHKLARGEDIGSTTQSSHEVQTFRAFAQKWFDDYVMPNNKYSERKAKRHILRASLVPFFGNMALEQITTEHLERYKALQLRAGIHPKTVNNRLTVLNKLLLTACEWKAREAAPPKVKKLSCPPVKTDYLSHEECELLLSSASGILYEMLLTTLRTGMRQGELKGLLWQAIDWDNRTLTVRYSWNDELQALETPKSNRERIIPLSADLYAVLFGRKRDEGFVFFDVNGTPFTEKRLNPLLAELCAKVGQRRITWHILRHTFATHLATNGTPLNSVQALLGHSAITTTMRYAHVPPSALRDAIDRLGTERVTVLGFGQPAGNQSHQASAA